MRIPRPLLLALLLAPFAGAACAADWQLVLSDRDRRIEIDRASILRSDAGTKVSWGRVVLTSEEAQRSGYAMIKALNRYDCRNRTFATVKRVYVDAYDNIVREEPVSAEAAIAVARNTVDERMWREVCDPPSAIELQKMAIEAARVAGGQVAAVTTGKPAADPVVALPAAKPVLEASRAQSGSVRQPAAEPVASDGGRTDPSGAEVAKLMPAIETPLATHVEIPAKFLPGGQGAATPDASRKSILPPLPSLVSMVEPSAKAPPALEPSAPQAPLPQASTPNRQGASVPVKAVSPEPRRAEAPSTRRQGEVPSAREKPSPAKAKPAAQAKSTAPRTRPQPAAVTAREEALRVAGIGLAGLGAVVPEWSYQGKTGPQNWGKMRPEWRMCKDGMRQSPIDLRDGIAVDLAPVQFEYRPTGFRIRDTGNTLEVEVGAGMGIAVRGVRYALEGFTLHRPSQDRVGGMAYDMAIYLQHRAGDGRMAIVSVQLSAGGEANAALQTLWNNLPLDRWREFALDAVLDLPALLPAEPGHYLYSGSLPVPPCTEDVLWVVMKQPVTISTDQLDVFARLYPRNGRPIQPRNGRLLLESR